MRGHSLLLDVITGERTTIPKFLGLGYEAQVFILVKGYRTACVLEGIPERDECVINEIVSSCSSGRSSRA
jgi:hypothetical protein